MSDSVRPLRRQPARLPRPRDSPGKNPGVGCHFLLQCVKVKPLSRVWRLATPWTAACQAPLSMGSLGESPGVGRLRLLRQYRWETHKWRTNGRERPFTRSRKTSPGALWGDKTPECLALKVRGTYSGEIHTLWKRKTLLLKEKVPTKFHTLWEPEKEQ